MVLLTIKKSDESLFLLECTTKITIDDILMKVCAIYNGRLKVYRICSEMEMLACHGPALPSNMIGLTEDQIEELKLHDEYLEICEASGGHVINKDPCQRRNGRQPTPSMQELLRKTIIEAKALISNDQVKAGTVLTDNHIAEALDILNGAVTIVYPMKLPPHDPIKMEFENREDLTGTQDMKMILELPMTQLWFAGKELKCATKISDYIGNNEKTKIVLKIGRRGDGAPSREPQLTDEQKKDLMMAEFKRREELKKLTSDDDDSYLNSDWADTHNLKKTFHGLQNVTWKPR